MGYDGPNYTQTPNLLLDEHLPDMGYAELKVVLVIVRQTMGWHKETDQLSISQLEEKTGLSNRSVIDGTRKALERGVIHRVRKGSSYSYRMVVKGREEGSRVGGEVTSQGVKQVHRGSEVSSQVGGEVTSHTKETVKETTTKEKGSAPARENPDKPSLDRVVTHATMNGIPEHEAKEFYYHYDAQDWEISKGKPIKRWKSKLKQWHLRQHKYGKNGSTPAARGTMKQL